MDNPLTEPEQFQAWKEHRLTVAFLQYLRDFRTQLAEDWSQGHPLTAKDQRQARTLGELEHLSVDDVRGFYGLDEETEQ